MNRTALAIVFLMGSSVHALSAATADGAQHLTSVFQSYLGSEPGVVTVTPAGDSYKTRLDLAPLFAKIREPGVSASLTPIEWTLTDLGGGKWTVGQNQPLSLAFKVEGSVDLKADIGAIKGTGTFDEALGAFASSATDFTQIALEQTIIDKGTTTKVAYTLASVHYDSTMTGTGDNADGSFKSTYKDIHETISSIGNGAMPGMDVSITSPGGSQDAIIKGLKPRAVNDLVAWLVARPTKETIIAEQAALKDKLRAALPVFANVSGVATINDLSVNTMMGKFGVQKVDVLVDMNGVIENGALREKFTFNGFEMPAGIVPPWAAGLAPASVSLDFSIADFNLAAPAKLLIDSFDLSKNPPVPDALDQQLQQALLPKGTVTLALGPSGVLAKIFDLKLEGSMTAGPLAQPAGQATVKLKGIDEIMAALQAAPPEMGMQQVAPMVIVAKGMGKQEPDGYLSWKIESTPQGSVTVNGVDLSKMGGQ
jgi:hypothetical protein